MTRWRVLVLAATLAGPAALQAQVVRGTVVDATDRALSGVVVALVDSTETVVARALSNETGQYRVVAPRQGTYRLRTLRIGFQPMLSAPIILNAGSVTDERLVLNSLRVTLETIRVIDRGVCGRTGASETGAIFSAWDQAMTSIAATTLTTSARGLTATTMQVERVLESDGRKIRSQTASMRTDYVTQPWRSLSPDTLRRRGYTQLDMSNYVTYYAPGLDVLVSSHFLEDHCLKLVAARDTTEIGVAFEPTAERRRLSEIRGTLWLSRATADLRRLSYTFTDAPVANDEFAAGGSMEFARLPEGAVVITAWEIRMPQLVKDGPRSTKVRIADVASTGGQLVALRRGADTLYKRASLAVSGVLRDSVSGNALSGAFVSLLGTTNSTRSDADGRFTLSDVLPGEYTIAVRTPSLDSVRATSGSQVMVSEGMTPLAIRVPTAAQLASSLCGLTLAGSSGRGKGALLGTVRAANDTVALGGVRVVADWNELVPRSGSVQREGRRMETRTDATGAYRLCGVPTETPLTVRAMPTVGRSQPQVARLAPDQRFASVALIVDPAKNAVATFSGTVVADSGSRPLAGAEVMIPSLSMTTRTNARGEFRLDDIPAGTHEVSVRQIGYGVLTTPMTFAANDEEERRVVLRPMQVLDSVEVIATRIDPGLKDFEDNRRVGMGHFMTREELAKNDGRKMGDVISMFPGAGVVRGRSGAWPMSKRYVVPIQTGGNSSIWTPTKAERNRGMVAGCYAQVFVDNKLMNPGQPTEPFDVNEIAPDQIEAIEWYAGPSQTPSRYTNLNSTCGVVVVHTRRFDSIKKP